MGKAYTEEFREEALKLMGEIGRGATSKKLGISATSLDNWRGEAEKNAPASEEKIEANIKIGEMAAKIRELERENARIKKENEFLEEAARFFAVSRQK